MRLFLSYSRDDKPWVAELWRVLQDSDHHAFLDVKGIVPAQDWWASILSAIEAAECVIYVMAPKAVESIYCRAEVAYALALNKPVLPLMLKSCDYPSELGDRRIQYQTITDAMSLDRVLAIIERALGKVQLGWYQHQYDPPASPPARPSEPRPAPKTDQAAEVYLLAAEAAKDGNEPLAEKRYREVIEADPDGWGNAAQERLTEFRRVREQRDRSDYERVKHLRDSGLLKDAQAAWRVYVAKHGSEYDPDGLARVLMGQDNLPRGEPNSYGGPVRQMLTPNPFVVSNSFASGVSPSPSLAELLPPPFAWVSIPAGSVVLEKGGYLRKNTSFQIPTFSITKYPITNAQYAKFIEAGGYAQPRWWTHAAWQHIKQKGKRYPLNWQANWHFGDHPVANITWYEATAFCQWLSSLTGERVCLPTEQQWQRAAQGDDGRVFSWGNTFSAARCNFHSKGTTPVTWYEGKGDSPFGVVDMVGNVWEWCLTTYASGDNDVEARGARVMRGGSFDNGGPSNFRVANRRGNEPELEYSFIGFRCAWL